VLLGSAEIKRMKADRLASGFAIGGSFAVSSAVKVCEHARWGAYKARASVQNLETRPSPLQTVIYRLLLL
jgi:hypothetical protein